MKTLNRQNLRFGNLRILLPVVLILVAVGNYAPMDVLAGPVVETKRTRVVQVALDQAPEISQYVDINSTALGYGKNACGLVAAASAVGGENWVPVVDLIANTAGSDYGPETGIQPSKYVSALQEVFGVTNVTASNDSTLEEIYDELAAGNIVIIDLKVSADTQSPAVTAPNYAHFARVLGMGMTTRQIYIENTLRGDAYWTLSFSDFAALWERPETTVSEILDSKNVEEVTRWLIVLDGSLVEDKDL